MNQADILQKIALLVPDQALSDFVESRNAGQSPPIVGFQNALASMRSWTENVDGDRCSRNYVFAAIPDDEIQSCAFDVSFKIDDYGEEHPYLFHAGLLRTKYLREQNALAPTVEWIMIRQKEIQLADFEGQIQTRAHMYHRAPNALNTKLIRFAYHAAHYFHVPNNELLAFATTTAGYIASPEDYPSSSGPLVTYLMFMAKPLHRYGEPNPMAKYMVPNKFPDVIAQFKDEQ